MKNSQRAVPTVRQGFIVPVLLLIIAALLIGGGAYVYVKNQKSVQPAQSNTQATSTPSQSSTVTQNGVANLKTYTDRRYRFSFSYPTDFALSNDLTSAAIPQSYSLNCTDIGGSNAPLCLWYIGKQTSDGFDAADLEVSISTLATATECTETRERYGQKTQQKSINGITYYYDLAGGAAVGHYLSTHQYRTYKNGACLTISLNVDSNPGKLEKGLDAKFLNMMFEKLEAVFDTFKFN